VFAIRLPVRIIFTLLRNFLLDKISRIISIAIPMKKKD